MSDFLKQHFCVKLQNGMWICCLCGKKRKSNYDHCYYNHRPFELEMKQIHEHFKEDKIIGKILYYYFIQYIT